MRRFARALLYFLLSLSFASVGEAIAAEKISGVVDKVRDGGMIRVSLDEGTRLPGEYQKCSKVFKTMAWAHLLGVEVPSLKKKEFCFREAAYLTRDTALGKRVKLSVNGCGRYGGLMAFVDVEDSNQAKSLNLELVKTGLAKMRKGRAIFRSEKEYIKYRQAEKKAEAARAGVWGSEPCKLKR